MPEQAFSAARRPWLIYFHSARSGPCRRTEGYLAQVLQNRRNHETFVLYRVDVVERPDLAAKFGVERVPTLVVVQDGRVRGRLERPRGCPPIERFLAGWLRSPVTSGRNRVKGGRAVHPSTDGRVAGAARQ
jgi:thioredoxin-like negative regulator of GroEL